MTRSVTLLHLFMLSLLDLVWSEDCGVPVFSERAADMVKISFKKGLRRTDFSKIEVTATLFNLVKDAACINIDETILLHNNDGKEEV